MHRSCTAPPRVTGSVRTYTPQDTPAGADDAPGSTPQVPSGAQTEPNLSRRQPGTFGIRWRSDGVLLREEAASVAAIRADDGKSAFFFGERRECLPRG